MTPYWWTRGVFWVLVVISAGLQVLAKNWEAAWLSAIWALAGFFCGRLDRLKQKRKEISKAADEVIRALFSKGD